MNLTDVIGQTVPQLVSGLHVMVGRINAVWSREHQADGRHAIPRFISQTPAEMGPSNFRGLTDTAMTWTVAVPEGVTTFDWWKHGDAMSIGFFITGTLGGTLDIGVSFDIPGGYRAKNRRLRPIFLVDAGARTTGYAIVEANSTTVDIYRTDSAVFTAGIVIVDGDIEFRTTV